MYRSSGSGTEGERKNKLPLLDGMQKQVNLQVVAEIAVNVTDVTGLLEMQTGYRNHSIRCTYRSPSLSGRSQHRPPSLM